MKIALAVVAAALAIVTPAVAGTPIVIGLPAQPNGGNCYPFGCGTLAYQQVYAPAGFAGVTTLTSISFYNTTYNSGGTNDPTVFTLHLSTTSKTVNRLSTTFADNLGTDNTLVYTGTVATPVFGGTFTLAFSTAFTYDPSAGSLLLDVTTTANNNGLGVYADSSTDDSKSRLTAFGGGPTGSASGIGLVTGFNLTGLAGVPEPASWLLMIAGFGGVGSAMRRRTATATATATA